MNHAANDGPCKMTPVKPRPEDPAPEDSSFRWSIINDLNPFSDESDARKTDGGRRSVLGLARADASAGLFQVALRYW